ncbi:MAG: exo-alpha-sialidase, partial [Chloroflexi bacterium]|nr:exo-alpha-sialidase [Chloroflexota bacterium]
MPVRNDVVLLVGTTKGLFLLDGSGEVRQPIANGASVPSVAFDARNRRMLAGKTSFFWGTGVVSSDDLGKTWKEPEAPNLKFPSDVDASIKQAWQIVPGTTAEPDVMYVGVEPAALFRSTDGGQTFGLVRGLWDHPHRPTWQPGGGGLCLHTIVLDDRNVDDLTVAISTGGVYRSQDRGMTWRPSNAGIRADFMPEGQRMPEYGQCVHKVDRDPDQPSTLYLQNHGGLYRSDDDGQTWQDIANGVPSDFGFPMVNHPKRSGTAYVIPLEPMGRWTPGGQARVYRTTDGGASWEPLSNGLPQEGAYRT